MQTTGRGGRGWPTQTRDCHVQCWYLVLHQAEKTAIPLTSLCSNRLPRKRAPGPCSTRPENSVDTRWALADGHAQSRPSLPPAKLPDNQACSDRTAPSILRPAPCLRSTQPPREPQPLLTSYRISLTRHLPFVISETQRTGTERRLKRVHRIYIHKWAVVRSVNDCCLSHLSLDCKNRLSGACRLRQSSRWNFAAAQVTTPVRLGPRIPWSTWRSTTPSWPASGWPAWAIKNQQGSGSALHEATSTRHFWNYLKGCDRRTLVSGSRRQLRCLIVRTRPFPAIIPEGQDAMRSLSRLGAH